MKKEKYLGVYRGIVEDINDPLNLGRCKIRVPAVHGTLKSSDIGLLPWARYSSPLTTGNNKGTFITPELNDIVWVLFESGDKQNPVYIGSTYGIVNGVNEAPLDGEDPHITETLYRSKLTNGKVATLKKNGDTFEFSYGNSFVKINHNGSMDVYSEKDATVVGDQNIDVSCKMNLTAKCNGRMSLNSGGDLDIIAGGNVTIKGEKVYIN